MYNSHSPVAISSSRHGYTISTEMFSTINSEFIMEITPTSAGRILDTKAINIGS